MSNKNARQVPFGFQLSATGGLVRDEAAQKIIAEIKRRTTEGHTPGAIAADLNARAVPTQRGGKWHPVTVRKVLAKAEQEQQPRQPLPFPGARPPQEQIERDGGFWFEDEEYDHDAKGWLPTRRWITAAKLTKQDEEAEQRRVQVEKLRQMSLEDQAKVFRFHESLPGELGDGWTDVIVRELTALTGRDVHALIDQINDPGANQKAVKANLRKGVNILLREIAVQRQVNLALRSR